MSAMCSDSQASEVWPEIAQSLLGIIFHKYLLASHRRK